VIRIDEKSMLPIYEQIVHRIKELISRGVLHEGEKMPSVRELSGQLLINPNTVAKAYQELERQGVIVSVRGKGVFVAKPASSPGMEKERLAQLREQLSRLMVEAHHLGLSREQVRAWVEEEIGRYWRDEHADGSPSVQDH
jgi:GntR family transcriptional regulator